MCSNPLQTPSGIKNSLISFVHISTTLICVFLNKVHEDYWHSSSIGCQGKITN